MSIRTQTDKPIETNRGQKLNNESFNYSSSRIMPLLDKIWASERTLEDSDLTIIEQKSSRSTFNNGNDEEDQEVFLDSFKTHHLTTPNLLSNQSGNSNKTEQEGESIVVEIRTVNDSNKTGTVTNRPLNEVPVPPSQRTPGHGEEYDLFESRKTSNPSTRLQEILETAGSSNTEYSVETRKHCCQCSVQ